MKRDDTPGTAPGRPGAVVVGHGILADAVARALGDAERIPEDVVAVPSLLVDVADSWTGADPRRPSARGDVPFPYLPVWTEVGRTIIGPLTVPGGTGCLDCLELRRRLAHQHPERRDALREQHGGELASRPSGWITDLAGATVGALVADEWRRLLDPRENPRTESAVLIVDLVSLSVGRHTFLPDPMCPRCGTVPEDSRDLAEITLRPRPKPGPTTYRVRDLTGRLEEVVDTFVDAECGMVSSLVSGAYGGVPVSIAASRCRQHDASEPGFGRAPDFRQARLTAVLEALERFAGAQPGGRRAGLVASYGEIADRAIDPRSFGLHAPEAYHQPGFSFQPFDPARPTRWVWGYSFGRAEPVLVPEGAAFWHTHPEAGERPYFFEISNGCALGGCIEEAILHGILEVVERDAFLMTWYARLPVPEIDLRGVPNDEVRLLSSVISATTGYEVLAFDTTMEHGIASVWTMAVHPDDKYEIPKAVCAAGAHLDPTKALTSALSELGPALDKVRDTFSDEADRARELVHDSSKVTSMDDHATLYGAFEAFRRLDFLTAPGRVRAPIGPDWSADPDFRHGDLTEDLRSTIRRLAVHGMDIVVVDQTIPEHRRAGLSCVKVLVPGTLSMTFGHQHRRTDGMDRLCHVPEIVARRAGIAGYEPGKLNPYPHPFP